MVFWVVLQLQLYPQYRRYCDWRYSENGGIEIHIILPKKSIYLGLEISGGIKRLLVRLYQTLKVKHCVKKYGFSVLTM